MKRTIGLGFGIGFNFRPKYPPPGSTPAPTPGSLATTFADTPTVHYHVGTSPLTMLGGNAAFTGRMTNSTTLVVESMTSGSIVVGMEVDTPVFKGDFPASRIVSQSSGTTGQAGTYVIVPGCNSSLPPTGTAFVASGDRVVLGVGDLKLTADLTGTAARGPILMTDIDGRKFLRFAYTADPAGMFLSNNALANLDSHNMAWFFAGRVLNSKGGGILGLGVNGGAGASTATNTGVLRLSGGMFQGVQTTEYISGLNRLDNSVAANRNKMILGAQLQVFGVSSANLDGWNTGSSAAGQFRHYLNNEVVTFNTTVTRYNTKTGFEIGRTPSNPTNGYASMDVYEIVGFLTGQFTTANQATKADAAAAAMVTNYAIPAVTRNLLLIGDSRMEMSASGGPRIATLLAGLLPKDIRIQNLGWGGGGVREAWLGLHDPDSAYGANNLLGGGNDAAVILYGVNEYGNAPEFWWPVTNTTSGTTARADEVFNGSIGCSFMGYIAGSVLTVTSISSGKPEIMMPITGAGVNAGLYIRTKGTVDGAGLGTYNLNNAQTLGSSGSPVAITGTFGSYVKAVQELLNRSFKVVHTIEPSATPSGTATLRLSDHIRNDLLTAVDADPGGLYDGDVGILDIQQITLDGLKIFGADSVVDINWYRDSVHPSDRGRPLLVTGADTPSNGIRAAITATMGY